MTHGRWVLAAVACAVWTVRAVSAADVQPDAVTLDQALELVDRQNPDARAARLQVVQAETERQAAAQLPNPTFGTNTSNMPLSRTQPPGLSVSQTIQTGIGLSQPLIMWGKRGLRIEGAEAGIAVAREQERDVLRQLRAAVKEAFFHASRDGRVLAFATENQRRYQQVVDLNQRRFRSGDISEVEFHKIELEGLRYVTDVEDARRSASASRALLGRLIGLDRPVDTVGEPGVLTIAADDAELVQRALSRRPDLAALARAREQADLQLQLARRERYPDVTVNASYVNDQWTRGGDMRNTVGIGFSVPVPLLNQNQAAIARADVAVRQVDTEMARLRLDIAREVRDALATYRAARALREQYERGYLERAQIVVTGAESSYRAGAASLIDLLDAERTYTATQTTYLDTLLAARTGAAGVELAVGEDFAPK